MGPIVHRVSAISESSRSRGIIEEDTFSLLNEALLFSPPIDVRVLAFFVEAIAAHDVL